MYELTHCSHSDCKANSEYKSCVTYEWVTVHIWIDSLLPFRLDTRGLAAAEMADWKARREYKSDVTYEWVTVNMWSDSDHCFHPLTARLTADIRVVSHMNASWYIYELTQTTAPINWLLHCSRVTYEWVVSHMNESCHIWMSRVTYEWVMSHMNASWYIYELLQSTEYSTAPMGWLRLVGFLKL